jgi:Transmembrane amino acid transporter protein
VQSFLGWYAGTIFFVVGGVLSLYCNLCLASLHNYNGKRCIRFRELTSEILGKWAYYPTFVLQVTLAAFVLRAHTTELLQRPEFTSLKPIGYTWSYLACRIGHWVPIWQPIIGSTFQ